MLTRHVDKIVCSKNGFAAIGYIEPLLSAISPVSTELLLYCRVAAPTWSRCRFLICSTIIVLVSRVHQWILGYVGCFVGKEDMYVRDGLHLSGKGAAVFSENLLQSMDSGTGCNYLN